MKYTNSNSKGLKCNEPDHLKTKLFEIRPSKSLDF